MTLPGESSAQREHMFFTWSAQADARPFAIDDAEGPRFHVPGKGWVWDLESQVYNVAVGHRHPHVRRRMVEQIDALPAAAPNVLLPVRARLAGLLHEVTGFAKAFLTTGGAEAVENAIKIARLYTGRDKIVTRRRSYHGATFATLAVGGDPRRAPFERVLGPGLHVDDPYPPRAPGPGRPSDWVESLQAVLDREGPETIAAILLEGYTGTNGMQVPPADFWPEVRRRCTEHGILLIDDEVFAGFGRTGRWFAHEHWGARPDVMVLGKAMTSGYAPLAGVVVSQVIADHFEHEVLACGLTHYAHPVSCAAAVGAIEVVRDEGLVDNAARVGDALLGGLRDACRAIEGVVDVRGLGLMMLVELDRSADGLGPRLWERGAHAPTRGRTLMLCPPLCLSPADAGTIVALVADALREHRR